MQPDRWAEVTAVFEKALTVPPNERERFLYQVCGNDEGLREEVESLLEANDGAGRFFDRMEGRVGALIASKMEPEPAQPERIGNYRLTRLIGRGGMGVVYQAQRENSPSSPFVALKVLRSELNRSDFHARFLSERQILAYLDHPNIARLAGGGLSDTGLPYYVMEFVQGQPIDQYCEQHKLGTRERLELFVQVAVAVQHAHARRVAHRDLKPSNILVTARGQVKLLDFGIAKVLSGDSGQVVTRTGMRLLTLEYAAPEQLRREPITTITDIYQLGAVLYRLVAGRHVFAVDRNKMYDLERRILEEEPEPPSRVSKAEGSWREVPADVDAIILKALQKDPNQRYASAAELLEDIRLYLAGKPVKARPRGVFGWLRR